MCVITGENYQQTYMKYYESILIRREEVFGATIIVSRTEVKHKQLRRGFELESVNPYPLKISFALITPLDQADVAVFSPLDPQMITPSTCKE